VLHAEGGRFLKRRAKMLNERISRRDHAGCSGW
jgi:hypothetical protein